MLRKLRKYLLPTILAIIVFSLYLPTLARSIYLEDSAEFVTGAATLSIVHPSGYPTWILFGKLFSYLPIFDNIAARINFLSLFFAVLAVIFLFHGLKKLFNNNIIAFSLSFLFAVSPMVWLQATYAEVYSLNTFFLALLLWLYTYYENKPSHKRLCLLLFVYGLSLTNHFLMLPLAPAIIIWLFYKFHPHRNIKLYIKLLLAFTAGLLPYAYIPLRSAMKPPFSWFNGNIEKLLTYNLTSGHTISWHTMRYLADIINLLIESYSWFGLILFAFGLLLMLYQHWRLRYLAIMSFTLFSIGLIIAIVGSGEYTTFAAWFYRYLCVPALMSSIIFIGYALMEIYNSRFRMMIFYPILLTLMIWPITQLGQRFSDNNLSSYIFLDNYLTAMMRSLPKRASFFVHLDPIVNDNFIFGLSYERYIKNLRPDIKIFSLTNVFLPPRDIPIAELKKQKTRLWILEKYLNTKRDSVVNLYTIAPLANTVSNGLAYKFLAKDEKPKITSPKSFYIPDNLYLPATENNPFNQMIIAKWYYDQAARLYAQNKTRSGQWFLVRAIEFDPDPNSDYYQRIVHLRDSYAQN